MHFTWCIFFSIYPSMHSKLCMPPLMPPPPPSPVIDGGEWNKSLVNFGFVNSVSIVIPLVEVNQSIISLVVLYKLDTHCIAFGNYNIQTYMACLQTSDLPIFRNSDLPIFRTSDLPIFRTSDLPRGWLHIRPSKYIPNPEKISLGPFEKLF